MVRVVVASAEHGGKAVERPWLGARLQPVTPDIADSLGLKTPTGALVATVDRNSPAAQAGLKAGDLILSIDKQAEFLNCGIAIYEFEPDPKGRCMPALELWNYGAPLDAEGAPKTSAPDAMAGTR